MVKKWDSIALVFPLEFRDFFTFIILEIRTHYNKKLYGKFLNEYRKILVKGKKNPCCTSGCPVLLSSLSNFEFFFAFIILEILTGHKKK